MTERLTHSKRSSFQICPRAFFYRYEQKLELRAQRPGRRRGTIFGDALQVARDSLDSPELEGEGVEAHPLLPLYSAMDAIDEAYDELGDAANDQDDADSLEVERVKVRVMVQLYLERYGLKARREVEYDLPFRNPATGGYSKTFRIAGKIDGMEVVGPQRARVIEDKFVAQIQKAMIDRLPLDQQSSEYVSALLAKGWTAEVAYRHTRYPGVNPTKEKHLKTMTHPAETLEAFEQRLLEDVQARPEFYFDEQLLIFPTSHLGDFAFERWVIGQQIIDARARSKRLGIAAFPKSTSRCAEFGGCAFIPICTGQADAMDRYEARDPEIELSEVHAS